MLKRSNRLSTKQFLEVMEKGRVTHSPLFVMRTLGTQVVSIKEDGVRSKRPAGRAGGGSKGENTRLDIRIAAVAPKKVAPTAVLRNSIKRHIYEAVQPLIASVTTSAGQGIHIIIFAKTEAVKADFKGIAADLKSLFVKARLSV
jgi:ribonuclease P protein component